MPGESGWIYSAVQNGAAVNGGHRSGNDGRKRSTAVVVETPELEPASLTVAG